MDEPGSGTAQPVMQRKTGQGDLVAGPNAVLDNRTGLPDAQVQELVMAHWVEVAGLQMAQPSTFQLYSTNPSGSMLNRSPFRVPLNVIEEVKLARQVADTDDDVMAVIGQALATGFGEGMQNQHPDEQTVLLFNRICGPISQGGMNMDRLLKEIYREYLIAAQFTTITLFTRTRYNFAHPHAEERVRTQLTTPLVGVLPAENIRALSNDIFGNSELGYDPTDIALRDWLERYFDPQTTPAIRNRMAEEQPVLAAIFTGRREMPWNDPDMFSAGKVLYTLNSRMVHRTTMAKGGSAYPRPMLTANFALLEAKRLLNIMDYALLQGGTNYIVVAKQGSDQLPAKQPEVDNLVEQVRASSRTGVLVGDHRLQIEIITPDLTELLNPAKRKLLGRKLAMAMLRIPEQVTGDPGNAGATQELEFTARSITSDRRDIRRHIEGNIYGEIAARNIATFTKGAPSLWFPRIVLAGIKDFFSAVLQLRDRGDIPRSAAVTALGYDYDAGLAEREREKQRGDDEILTPGYVPNSSPTGTGRPPGSSSNNGRPGGQEPPIDPPQRQRQLPPGISAAGEAIVAQWDASERRAVRYGELTAAVLEAHPDHVIGRVTDAEREAVTSNTVVHRAATVVIPVNPDYGVGELRAFRLADGLAMIVGPRTEDSALVARAMSFREPQFDLHGAEDAVLRWGFITETYTEVASRRRPARCTNCGNQLPSYSPLLADIGGQTCPSCGAYNAMLDTPQPRTVEEVVAVIATQAREVIAGLDITALAAGFQATFAETVATAVAKALTEAGINRPPA